MKRLMPVQLMAGNAPEYEIVIQAKISEIYALILSNIGESEEKKKALDRLQEASFWLTAAISVR